MRDILDIVPKTAYLIGIVGVSVLIAGGIVSYVIYKPKDDPENPQYEEEESSEIQALFDDTNYDKKYQNEFDDLEERKLDNEELAELRDKPLEEETPLGIVKMHYNSEYGGFEWYCDTSHVPYRFLETVVRKYIIENDCLQLYVNLKEEIDKSNQLVEKAREKLDKADDKQESVFIQKKSDNKDVLDVLAIKNKYLKFKYLGKLEEVKAESVPVYNMINIDFSTFKSLKEKSS
tara:strand:- start:920 stop:1618 length:699 start_codon:yes stop_codon:yes gene_type:complete